MSTTPLLSIGLFLYNGEKFLAAAIESILNQTFTDFELIISDNRSNNHPGHQYRRSNVPGNNRNNYNDRSGPADDPARPAPVRSLWGNRRGSGNCNLEEALRSFLNGCPCHPFFVHVTQAADLPVSKKTI